MSPELIDVLCEIQDEIDNAAGILDDKSAKVLIEKFDKARPPVKNNKTKMRGFSVRNGQAHRRIFDGANDYQYSMEEFNDILVFYELKKKPGEYYSSSFRFWSSKYSCPFRIREEYIRHELLKNYYSGHLVGRFVVVGTGGSLSLKPLKIYGMP